MELAEQAGDPATADRLFEQAIAAERAVDDQPGLLRSLMLRGAVAAPHGKRRVAAAALAQAVEVGELHTSKLHLAHLLEAMANLVLDRDLPACIRLAGSRGKSSDCYGRSAVTYRKARPGRYLEVAKQRIGERAYAELWRDAQSAAATFGRPPKRRCLADTASGGRCSSAAARAGSPGAG